MIKKVFFLILLLFAVKTYSANDKTNAGDLAIDSIIKNSIHQKNTDSLKVIEISEKSLASYKGKATSIKVFQFKKEQIAYVTISFLVIIIGLIIYIKRNQKRRKRKANAIQSLTERELAVLQLIKSGKQNKEIADTLFISISTVKTHINSIYKKLNVSSRKEIKNRY